MHRTYRGKYRNIGGAHCRVAVHGDSPLHILQLHNLIRVLMWRPGCWMPAVREVQDDDKDGEYIRQLRIVQDAPYILLSRSCHGAAAGLEHLRCRARQRVDARQKPGSSRSSRKSGCVRIIHVSVAHLLCTVCGTWGALILHQ